MLNILSIQSGGVKWVVQMFCSARVLMTSRFKPNWGENYSAVKFLFLSAFSSRKFSGKKNKKNPSTAEQQPLLLKTLNCTFTALVCEIKHSSKRMHPPLPPHPRGNPFMQNVSPNSFLESWVLVSFQVPSVPPAGGEDSLSQSTPPFWLINKLYWPPWHN